MSLPEIRQKIDSVDHQLIALLNERADLVHQVGEVKRAKGTEIYAPEREEQVLRSLAEKNRSLQGRLPERAIRAIYREIMSASLALEKDLSIAYLGPVAASTHQAARSKFGVSVEYVAQASIGDVFDAVARGTADYGVVPIENSTDGAVNHTLDMFMESDLRICAQIHLKIESHLLSSASLDEIRRIYAHPQVLEECGKWLRRHLPSAELIEVSSTPRAAELAAAEPHAAALAGPLAGEEYGLQIAAPSVQDLPHSITRFLVLGQSSSPPTGQDRTALMFCLRDAPGALYSALEPFQRLSLSLSKIESRPSLGKVSEDYFFVNVDGHSTDPTVQEALRDLEKHCALLKILGSYPRTEASSL